MEEKKENKKNKPYHKQPGFYIGLAIGMILFKIINSLI